MNECQTQIHEVLASRALFRRFPRVAAAAARSAPGDHTNIMACNDAPIPITGAALAKFRDADQAILAKRGIAISKMRALDSSGCAARTEDGVVKGRDGMCIDIGEPFTEAPSADGSHGHTPLAFLAALPDAHPYASEELREHAARMQAAVALAQFPPDGKPRCRRSRVYYMHELPQVGLGSIIEYAVMFLGRSLSIGEPAFIRAETSSSPTCS